MDINQNYFQLFGLTPAIEVDLALLSLRHHELQKTLHPDRFAGGAQRDQLMAVQYTAFLNDAYVTLKHPIKRALYLLELRGRPLSSEAATTRDAAFLMQQMEWREALEEARSAADPLTALEALETEVARETRALLKAFETSYAQADAQHLEMAVDQAKKLQFMDKMRREIEALEEDLSDF